MIMGPLPIIKTDFMELSLVKPTFHSKLCYIKSSKGEVIRMKERYFTN